MIVRPKKTGVMKQRSQTPVAIRQRRSRRMRKGGLRSYRVYLPAEQLAEAVRQRENIPAAAAVPHRVIERALFEDFSIWMGNWQRLKRHR